MNEKLYKAVGSVGAANLAIGICVLIGGIVSGILLIVNGGRLLKHRSYKESGHGKPHIAKPEQLDAALFCFKQTENIILHFQSTPLYLGKI